MHAEKIVVVSYLLCSRMSEFPPLIVIAGNGWDQAYQEIVFPYLLWGIENDVVITVRLHIRGRDKNERVSSCCCCCYLVLRRQCHWDHLEHTDHHEHQANYCLRLLLSISNGIDRKGHQVMDMRWERKRQSSRCTKFPGPLVFGFKVVVTSLEGK